MKKIVGFDEETIDLTVPITGDIRTTKSELTFYSSVTNSSILVPIGIKTDLGSIPQFLQSIFPKDGKAMFGYILHDYLYKTGMCDRTTSDDILAEAMESLGVSKWRVKSVRLGLRLGGWKAYNKYKKERK